MIQLNIHLNLNTFIIKIIKNDIRLDLIRINEQHDWFFDEFVQQTEGMSFLLKESNPFLDLENVLAFLSNREASNFGEKKIQIVWFIIKLIVFIFYKI